MAIPNLRCGPLLGNSEFPAVCRHRPVTALPATHPPDPPLVPGSSLIPCHTGLPRSYPFTGESSLLLAPYSPSKTRTDSWDLGVPRCSAVTPCQPLPGVELERAWDLPQAGSCPPYLPSQGQDFDQLDLGFVGLGRPNDQTASRGLVASYCLVCTLTLNLCVRPHLPRCILRACGCEIYFSSSFAAYHVWGG